MKWSTKVIAIVIGVGMLYPTLSMAQPAGRTKSGEYARGLAAPLLSVGYFPLSLWSEWLERSWVEQADSLLVEMIVLPKVFGIR